jgi:hypothetical protein
VEKMFTKQNLFFRFDLFLHTDLLPQRVYWPERRSLYHNLRPTNVYICAWRRPALLWCSYHQKAITAWIFIKSPHMSVNLLLLSSNMSCTSSDLFHSPFLDEWCSWSPVTILNFYFCKNNESFSQTASIC